MNKKLYLVIFSTFFLLFSWPIVLATTRYVSTTGTDVGDCSVTPCKTIQYAIGQSNPDDTILVDNGNYDGFDANKVGITVKASSSPVINGAGIAIDGQLVGILVSAHNVTIQGFTVTGSYSTGIYIFNSVTPPHGARILNNKVDQTTFDPGALASWDGSGIMAKAGGSPPTVIFGNDIKFGVFDYTRAHNGIKLFGDNDPDYIISTNTITMTITSTLKYKVGINLGSGVGVVGKGSAVIENNVITSPNKPLGSWTKVFGIWLYGGAGAEARNVRVEGNKVTRTDYAFWVKGPNTDNILAQCNDFIKNDFGAVIEGNAVGVKINRNNIYGNTVKGVHNGGTVLVDAENNWWGSSTGPTHPSNPDGTGDKVTDNVDFEPWSLLPDPCKPRPVPSLNPVLMIFLLSALAFVGAKKIKL